MEDARKTELDALFPIHLCPNIPAGGRRALLRSSRKRARQKDFARNALHVLLGTPAGTPRSFGEPEFRQISRWIIEVTEGLAANGEDGNGAVEAKVKAEIEALCLRFPIFPEL